MDDNEYRHTLMKQTYIGYDIDYFYNAKDTITALENNTYDILFLDHDLDEEFNNVLLDCAEDGRFVAKHIATNLSQKYKNAKIFIHSLNAPGAEIMKSILISMGINDVVCFPFAWKIKVYEN